MKKVLGFIRSATLFLVSLGAPTYSIGEVFDFTDMGVWGSANGQNSFQGTVGIITATLTAKPNNALLTTNTIQSEIDGCTSASAGLACGGDGIGINDDEVSSGTTPKERLILTFDTAVDLASVSFLDLFDEKGPNNERAKFQLFDVGGSTIGGPFLVPHGSNPGGFVEFTVGSGLGENVSMIKFWAPGKNGVSDFALAAVNVAAVPLPAAAWLFGSALMGLTVVSRRKNKAAVG